MTKSKLNLIIEGVMLLCMGALAGIGLLMKYVLIAGFRRGAIYGRNVELCFWGLDRHQWGTIHLVIASILISLLVVHIALHWAMILAIYRKLIPDPLTRRIIAIVMVLLVALLLAFPYFVKPEVREGGQGQWRTLRDPHTNANPARSQQTFAPQGAPTGTKS